MREYNYRFSSGLINGLRTSERNRRGVQALTLATGMVPYDGALNSLPELEQLDISSISPAPSFPFPQIFKLKRLNIVCTSTQIYELDDDGTLTLAIEGLVAGLRWSVADFHHFLVLANGKQLVFRGGETKKWTTVNTYALPNPATSVLNYKGQLILTGPDETVPETEIPAPMLDFSQPWHSQYLQVGIY